MLRFQWSCLEQGGYYFNPRCFKEPLFWGYASVISLFDTILNVLFELTWNSKVWMQRLHPEKTMVSKFTVTSLEGERNESCESYSFQVIYVLHCAKFSKRFVFLFQGFLIFSLSSSFSSSVNCLICLFFSFLVHFRSENGTGDLLMTSIILVCKLIELPFKSCRW